MTEHEKEQMTMAATATPATTRTFVIDRAHSEVGFQVRHLVSRVHGRFSDFEGTVHYDAADPTRSSVHVTIVAASIDTADATRDTHLRSADFFAADEFKSLTFVSSAIRRVGEDEFEVDGDLTIRGVRKPVTLRATFLGIGKDPWGAERIGFEASVTLNRKDYGLLWNAALETGGFLVGDEVKVTLSIEAMAKN
jgi:polyisoprenoid-binding protein YceI